MIKVYHITRKGKSLIRDHGNPQIQGKTRGEVRKVLGMYHTENSVEDTFIFDSNPNSPDHSFRQHINLLEKAKCLERDTSKEQDIKDYLKTLPKEETPSLEEFMSILYPDV